MKKMEFSKFLDLMNTYLIKASNQEDRIRGLTNLFIEDDEDKEKNEDDTWEEKNPIADLGSSTLKKYCFRIPKETADTLLRSMDAEKVKIKEEIEKAGAETDGLIKELNEYGIPVDQDNLGDICYEIYRAFLKGFRDKKSTLNVAEFLQSQKLSHTPSGLDALEWLIKEKKPTKIKEGKLYIGQEVYDLPRYCKIDENNINDDLPFMKALFEVYEEITSIPVKKAEDINSLEKEYRKDFTLQKKYFASAAGVEKALDGVCTNEETPFQDLEEEAYDGIQRVYYRPYKNGYTRLDKVLDKIVDINLNSVLVTEIRLIRPLERMGLCHIMVNDERIRSWVDPEDEDEDEDI